MPVSGEVPADAAERDAGTTVGSLLRAAMATLRPSRTASLDAQLLLAHVVGRDRAWVVGHHAESVGAEANSRFRDYVARRRAGEPVSYLTGRKAWYDMKLEVGPGVLVPRPETELLLERACEIARARRARVVADIGTGSGALALGLARCLPETAVEAVDRSAQALEYGRRNVARYGLGDRVRLRQGHLAEPLVRQPDLIVANLPYLSDGMMAELDADVRAEPAIALHGGRTGLELYEELAHMLESRGWRVPLIIEIDPRQAPALPEHFPGWRISIEQDYTGRDRIAILRPEPRP
jgi:release factor glutamine methyltransferase